MNYQINPVQNADELQKIVGKPHAIIKAKVLPQLDRHCLAYLKQSQVVFCGFRYAGIADILILSGNPGFIEAADHVTLEVPSHQELLRVDNEVFVGELPVSLYCWIPGIGETLRINGLAKWSDDNKKGVVAAPGKALKIKIKGAFLHCAKPIRRAKLWSENQQPGPTIAFDNTYSDSITKEQKLFIEASPFLCLHTQNDTGKTELSPRGDPPGFVHIISNKQLLIPDRPGNKRMDSMYNLLNNPHLGIIFLLPGSNQVLKINGRASLIHDPKLLQSLAISNQVPKLGILVTISHCRFHQADSLNWPEIWEQARKADKTLFPPLGQILAEQTTTKPTLATKIKGKIVAVVINRDYRKNMY